MMKLDLRGFGRPKNEGAWRLAWHIAEAHRGDIHGFSAVSRIDPMLIERVLRGEVIPGDGLALTIWAAGGARINKLDFQMPLRSVRWYDRPRTRHAERRAA